MNEYPEIGVPFTMLSGSFGREHTEAIRASVSMGITSSGEIKTYFNLVHANSVISDVDLLKNGFRLGPVSASLCCCEHCPPYWNGRRAGSL